MLATASRGRRSLPLALIALICLLASVGAETSDAKPKKGKGKPRLEITSVVPAQSSVPAGSNLRIDGTIRNKGKQPYGGPGDRGAIEIELRGEEIGTIGVGTAAIPRVPRKKTRSFSTIVAIPISLNPEDGTGPVGPFDVVACVLAQGDEGNRGCRAAADSLTVNPADPPDFSPGARSLGDRLFPQIGNGGYDALNYAINLDYDPVANSFAPGTSTTMTAKATQDLSEFSLDFQRDLTVSAVTVNGAPAGFQQVDATPEFAPGTPAADQPAKLVVTPSRGIHDTAGFTVKVEYAGTPDEITDADGSNEGWIRACEVFATETGCDGSFTVNEPIGAQSWYPSNNYPSDKATIDTTITVPSTHVTIGTGELTGEPVANGDGTTTWSWSEDDPTSTYLASATVGLFDYSDDTPLTETLTGRTIPMYLAIDSAIIQPTKDLFATRSALIPSTTNFFSDRLGPYPFDSTGAIVDVANSVFYALENQTKPHYSENTRLTTTPQSVSTQAHEIAHQWMGDNVGPATWDEIWFNEGWATFAQTLWDGGAAGGATDAEMRAFFDDIYATPDSEWDPAPAALPGPEDLFAGFPVYDRPAGMLEGFREIVGDDAFYGFARSLNSEYAYGNISLEEFIAEAKAASGLAGAQLDLLDAYFRQWLLSTTKPTITPDSF